MSATVYIALLGWPIVALVMFGFLPARRAAIASYLGAWMFLPQISPFVFENLPEYDKAAASAFSVLLGTVIFAPQVLTRFKPTWYDLPMLIWLICPMFSALANDVGNGDITRSAYGGMTMIITQTMVWGMPYYIGRCYFKDFEALRELAECVFIAGLIYAPLCLLEVRLAPRLHLTVYGRHAHSFVQTIRLGGFRPTVFMQHGLMVGLFMAGSTVVGFWLWLSRAKRELWSIPIAWLVFFMMGVTVLCKSSGAIALMAMAVTALLCLYYLNWRIILLAMILIAPTYVTTRSVGLWTGDQLVNYAEKFFGADRAGSVAGRMRNEDLFTSKASERPILGWSGWNRFQAFDDRGWLISTPDGMWVIARGQFGVVGLASLGAFLLIPAVVIFRRYPKPLWNRAALGPPLALTVLLLMFTIDCLMNAMISPLYLITSGALISVLPYGKVVAAPKPAAPIQPTRGRRLPAHS